MPPSTRVVGIDPETGETAFEAEAPPPARTVVRSDGVYGADGTAATRVGRDGAAWTTRLGWPDDGRVGDVALADDLLLATATTAVEATDAGSSGTSTPSADGATGRQASIAGVRTDDGEEWVLGGVTGRAAGLLVRGRRAYLATTVAPGRYEPGDVGDLVPEELSPPERLRASHLHVIEPAGRRFAGRVDVTGAGAVRGIAADGDALYLATASTEGPRLLALGLDGLDGVGGFEDVDDPIARWRVDLPGTSITRPLVTDGRVHVATDEATFGLDSRTGEERWRHAHGGRVAEALAAAGDVCYVATRDPDRLLALGSG